MCHKNNFFIILFPLLIPISTSISIISTNQTIKDGDILVSEGGVFALGFFSPGNSSNRFVGIWYKNISEQTIVWVANRQNPINDSSGVVSVDTKGNLILHGNDQKTPVWSTNISVSDSGNSNFFAQLMNTGNLVLFQGDRNKEVVVWESFDYPSHTLLPYMKLGVNLRTGLDRFLTSWKSHDDPRSGGYTFKMDLNGSPPQTFLSKGQNHIWRTGPWNGIRWTGVPQMTQNFIFTITYVENSSDVYMTYNLIDSSVFSRMILNESGTMQRLTWHADRNQWVEFWSAPKDQCDYYNHCGTYGNCNSTNLVEFECQCLPGYEPKSSRDWYLRDGSGGCVAKRGEDMCQAGAGFVKVPGGKMPDTNVGVVNRSIGLKECEVSCLRNCSCKGYASLDISQGGTGCITWHGDLVDTREFSSGGQDFFLRVDAFELAEYRRSQQSKGKKNILGYILGPIAAVFIVLIFIILFFVQRKRRGTGEKQALLFSPNFSTPSLGAISEKPFDDSVHNQDLQHIDLGTIISATDNFSFANKLGHGGFGTVYKGLLANGQEIAVKRLGKNSGQGDVEFKNEVTLIAKLQHRNLVRLLAFCIQEEEKMLIYEYLPNKGLDSFIFDEKKGSMIDWRKRHDIILGIARGLLYLHQDSRLRIIHRDLKASNVLLDASMNPKISDFGMARIFGGDQIEANTNRVVGTYGYMSPEYAMEGLFSVKSDVFSFGVLLLEIIGGKKNNSYYLDNSVNLIGHVWSLWNEDKALEAVDPLLEPSSYPTHEVLRCLHIGLLCVQEHAADRPTMSDVSFMLSQETVLPPPKQPAFILKAKAGQYSSSASVGASSSNDLTLSIVEAR